MVSTHRKIFVKLKFTSPNFRVENSQNLSNHHLQTIQRSLKLPTQTQHFRWNPWNLYHMFAASLIQLLPKWISFNDKCAIPHSGWLGCFFTIGLQGATFIGHELWWGCRLQTSSFWGISHAASQKPCVLFFCWVETNALINAVLGKSVGFCWGKSCLLL